MARNFQVQLFPLLWSMAWRFLYCNFVTGPQVFSYQIWITLIVPSIIFCYKLLNLESGFVCATFKTTFGKRRKRNFSTAFLWRIYRGFNTRFDWKIWNLIAFLHKHKWNKRRDSPLSCCRYLVCFSTTQRVWFLTRIDLVFVNESYPEILDRTLQVNRDLYEKIKNLLRVLKHYPN